VPAVPPMKYVLGYQTLTLNLTVTLKITTKENDTGLKLNIELYLKVDFLVTGVGLKQAYNRKRN